MSNQLFFFADRTFESIQESMVGDIKKIEIIQNKVIKINEMISSLNSHSRHSDITKIKAEIGVLPKCKDKELLNEKIIFIEQFM